MRRRRDAANRLSCYAAAADALSGALVFAVAFLFLAAAKVSADTAEEACLVHAEISDKARLLQKFSLHEEYGSKLQPGNHEGNSLVHVPTNPCDVASPDTHGLSDEAEHAEEVCEYYIVVRSALTRVEPLFANNAKTNLSDDLLEELLDVPEELCAHNVRLPEELAYVDAVTQPALCLQLRNFLKDSGDEPR